MTDTTANGARRHRVVIIGAGFGGLAAARSLQDAPVDVVIVDARNHHTFQPLLYQVATAGLDGDDVCYPVRGIVARQRNTEFRLGRVSEVVLATNQIRFADGAVLGYDHLILAAGAITNDFGIPGVADVSFGMKSLTDALAMRAHILAQFERVDSQPELIDDGALTFVITGGGPTGVELAGGLVELFQHVLSKDFPRLDVTRARVVLLEATDRVLGAFHPALSEYARRALEVRGVEVKMSSAVTSASPTSVLLDDGTVIPCHTLIWAAGVTAHPIGGSLGVELTKGGRVVVAPDLSIPGHSNVFVVGDLAGSRSADDRLLPQVAPVAIQGARHAAEQIVARLHGSDTLPFHYVDKGSMATIGRHDAVAELPGGVRLTGTVGWLSWLALHLFQLLGFRNRLNVVVNWAWNYVTYDRASRIIPSIEES